MNSSTYSPSSVLPINASSGNASSGNASSGNASSGNASSGNASSGAAAPSTTASSTAPSTAVATPAAAKSPAGTPPKEGKAEVLREKVSETVEQLGRGWKTLARLTDQLRRHPLATILTSTAVLMAIGGSITVGVLEGRRRRTFSYRFKKGLRNVRRQLTR